MSTSIVNINALRLKHRDTVIVDTRDAATIVGISALEVTFSLPHEGRLSLAPLVCCRFDEVEPPSLYPPFLAPCK